MSVCGKYEHLYTIGVFIGLGAGIRLPKSSSHHHLLNISIVGPIYVTVQVTRASQNPPYFEQEEYDVPVNEGLMYNTTITTITAFDPDPGTFKPCSHSACAI